MSEERDENDENKPSYNKLDENFSNELRVQSIVSDVIYHKLSRTNGRINRMHINGIIGELRSFRLSTEGSCEILKRRLKNYYKNQALSRANLLSVTKLYPYYVIVDFEATCEEVNAPDYPHEIIEFPAVLIDTENKCLIDHFQSYCQPIINPELSDFCKSLTGITQKQVDEAPHFPEVLKEFENWLIKHNLGTVNKYAMVADGPWDMGRFLFGQCKISNISYPECAIKWINLRKIFGNFYKVKKICLKQMLEHLELNFEGRPHCGLDDAKNIGRILLRMVSDGACIQINEQIQMNKPHRNSNKWHEKNIIPVMKDLNINRSGPEKEKTREELLNKWNKCPQELTTVEQQLAEWVSNVNEGISNV